MYVQGNAVKRLQEVPRRTDLPDVQERRRLARERNQKSAVPVTPAKQVKSEITASMKNVANLESELAQLKEDNDAYYSQVTSDVDISAIKKKAIGELGMKYPSEDQIQTYVTEGNSYVRQYQDVDTHK